MPTADDVLRAWYTVTQAMALIALSVLAFDTALYALHGGQDTALMLPLAAAVITQFMASHAQWLLDT